VSTVAALTGEVRETGLFPEGGRVLAMLSGGADSVCLLHLAREVLGRESVVALHVNHGLRPAADGDERFCAELCRRLGVPLVIERVSVPGRGNTEALAREARYRAAEAARLETGSDRIATGHTATDQVETILYRLVSSPGRRALLGMSPRRGRLVRPLLGISADRVRAYCAEAGLPWVEDETNADISLARNRLRRDVLPALRQIHPAADANVLATAAQLRDEDEVLEEAADAAAAQVAAGGLPPAVEAARLRELRPALRRLLLQRLAEQAAGGPLPLPVERVAELERLAAEGGTRSLDLGAGVMAVSEYGVIRFRTDEAAAVAEPVTLAVPGTCVFGSWVLSSRIAEPGTQGSLDEPQLDRDRLTLPLTVRAWREGDRMRPLGLDGTKSLQDLFTDRKVPRSLRHLLPVVESGGEIAWVAGVAISDRFKLTADTDAAVLLEATNRLR
jgi:tRNA(Ile)-lysidine synthase